MLYTDDDSRHAFHQSPALLQVVCQILETYATDHGVQLELVDCERRAGMWIAALVLSDDLYDEAIQEIVDRANAQFQRADEIPTCQVESAETGLLSVRITEKSDFSLLL